MDKTLHSESFTTDQHDHPLQNSTRGNSIEDTKRKRSTSNYFARKYALYKDKKAQKKKNKELNNELNNELKHN